MITYSIIQKSQLEGAKRLDAEYYHSEKLHALSILDKLKGKKISDYFTNARETFNPSGKTTINETIVYDLSDALGFFMGSGKIVKSSKEIESSKKILKQNDVIISRLRSYLKEISFVFSDSIKNKICSTEFIVLRNKDKNIYPELLFSFLQTDLVQKILEWSQEGTNHPRFSSEALFNIKIPEILIKSQKDIKNLIDESFNLFENSKSIYQQAENLLLEELKISEKDLDNQLSCVVNLSDARNANRFDAEYFEPKYQKITEYIKNNFKWSLLGDLASVKKGFEPGAESYREEGKQFIRVSSLSKYEISDSEQKCLSDELYNKLKADFQPQKGEILLTKDASPGITYVLKEDIEGIISSGILRLKLKDKEIEDEYLALCLNSVIGKMQAERDAGGSVIMHWKPEEIKSVVIPILPKPIQEKITSLVRQSFESRIRAKGLLEEAKKRVEEIIEKV